MKTGKFLAILAVASLGIASSANAGIAPPPPVVPEPSTYIAGVLLLLPFGVSALRSLRRKQ